MQYFLVHTAVRHQLLQPRLLLEYLKYTHTHIPTHIHTKHIQISVLYNAYLPYQHQPQETLTTSTSRRGLLPHFQILAPSSDPRLFSNPGVDADEWRYTGGGSDVDQRIQWRNSGKPSQPWAERGETGVVGGIWIFVTFVTFLHVGIYCVQG